MNPPVPAPDLHRTALIALAAVCLTACRYAPETVTAPSGESLRPVSPAPVPIVPETIADAPVVEWPYITVDFEDRTIDLEGEIGIDIGWLEQIACSPRTREHETVVIAYARPSHVHAALLLLGLEPGRPGEWVPDEETLEYTVVPPQGPPLWLTLLLEGAETGEVVERPISDFVRDYHTKIPLPDRPWIFGGSVIRPDFEGVPTYVADRSGSLIGLVTFGDEVIGWSDVLPDLVDYRAPEWEINTETIPRWGTPVTLRIHTRRPGAPEGPIRHSGRP